MAACDSCGADADDLVAVHRIYLTPESWDVPEQVAVMPDVERWCVPCRTHYPHQLIDERRGLRPLD